MNGRAPEAGHGAVAGAPAPAEAICGRPFRVLAIVPLCHPSQGSGNAGSAGPPESIACCNQVVTPHRLGASRDHVLLGRPFLVNHHPPARRYTMARNTVGLCRLYGRDFPGLRRRQARELTGLAIKILLFIGIEIARIDGEAGSDSDSDFDALHDATADIMRVDTDTDADGCHPHIWNCWWPTEYIDQIA